MGLSPGIRPLLGNPVFLSWHLLGSCQHGVNEYGLRSLLQVNVPEAAGLPDPWLRDQIHPHQTLGTPHIYAHILPPPSEADTLKIESVDPISKGKIRTPW